MSTQQERRSVRRRLQEQIRAFRRASCSVKIPFRDRLRYWHYYLRLARRGKMVHSPTLDAQYEDSSYKRGYERYLEKINDRLVRAATPAPLEPPAFGPDELELPELQQLMRSNIPFLIRNGAERLPASRWTLEYLEQVAGDCEVPINEALDRPEDDTSRPSKAHHYYDFRRGRLAEVLHSIRTGGRARTSTAEDVMHHDGGRLREDLDLDYWERITGWDRNRSHWLRSKVYAGKVCGAQLLVQPPDAFTLWHAEPADNFFVLVRGHKTWTMAHPYYTAAMRPRVKTTTNYSGSNIDVREPDDVQRQRGFDGYLNVPKLRFDMGPGDVLRVPNHWWHTVETHSSDYVVGATIRAACMPNTVGIGYMFLRWLDSEYHVMAADFAKEGRVYDRHIGFPRKSRAAAEDSSQNVRAS